MPLAVVKPGLLQRTVRLLGKGIPNRLKSMRLLDVCVLLSLPALKPPGPRTKLNVRLLPSRRSDLAQRTRVGSHRYFSPFEWSYETYSSAPETSL